MGFFSAAVSEWDWFCGSSLGLSPCVSLSFDPPRLSFFNQTCERWVGPSALNSQRDSNSYLLLCSSMPYASRGVAAAATGGLCSPLLHVLAPLWGCLSKTLPKTLQPLPHGGLCMVSPGTYEGALLHAFSSFPSVCCAPKTMVVVRSTRAFKSCSARDWPLFTVSLGQMVWDYVVCACVCCRGWCGPVVHWHLLCVG